MQTPFSTTWRSLAWAHARDEAVRNAFLECLNAAVTLVREGKVVSQDLSVLIPLV